MKQFKRLFLTDFKNTQNITFGATGLYILLQLFFYISMSTNLYNKMIPWMVFFNVLIFASAQFIPFINSFTIWTEEWKQNTVYTLFSLPVNKMSIFFSKFFVVFTQLILLNFVAFLGGILQGLKILKIENISLRQLLLNPAFITELKNQGMDLYYFISKVTLTGIIQIITMILLVFFSILIGKSILNKSNGIIALVFILINALKQALTFMVLYPLDAMETVAKTVISVNIVISIVFCLLFIFGSRYFLNKKIEL